MSPMELGIVVAIVLIIVLLSGAPVAFSLGIVAVGFLIIFEGPGSLEVVAETLFGG
ncbi:MAG: TRAP transporter large permease, partial [Halobacteria archaeon]|nr:TRAP transporter large permease [Halobacteria archaeon]